MEITNVLPPLDTRDVCAISEFMRRNVGLLHSRQMFVKKKIVCLHRTSLYDHAK